MNTIIKAQKINDKKYELYVDGRLGDCLYKDAHYGCSVFKLGTWVLVQNTPVCDNDEFDYQTDNLEKALWEINCEVLDCVNAQEDLNQFLKHQ